MNLESLRDARLDELRDVSRALRDEICALIAAYQPVPAELRERDRAAEVAYFAHPWCVACRKGATYSRRDSQSGGSVTDIEEECGPELEFGECGGQEVFGGEDPPDAP